MTYGDGSYPFSAITSIDVVGHEIGHGVCENSANLFYGYESGAINEGLSDIWGAMIEFYSDPNKQTYLMGEELIPGSAFRSMSNPKYYGDPDTYGGTYWSNPNCGTANSSNDYCGVHSNSGVLNHWFYILAEGKSGTNDLGNSYNVAGIGKDKAAKIVYRAETVYFTSTTNFSQARTLTLQAANDLYGANSLEAITVCQSWFAVGVGSGNCIAAQITGPDAICNTTSNNTYTVSNLLPNSSVVWSVSANLSIVSSTNSTVVVKALNTTSGQSTITANISGQIVTKNVWLGIPQFNVQKTNETCGQYRFVTLTITNSDTSHIYNYSFSYLPTGVTYVQSSYNVFLFKISNTYTQNSFTYGVTATLGCSSGTYGNYVMFGSCPPFGSSTTNTLNATAVGESTIYKVYPNPSDNILNISLFDENNAPAKTSTINAILYDLNGQKVDGITVVNNIASLNVSHYKKGIYVLTINIDGKTETHQVIVK
nr:M4 family metallopeptidase [Flavobacterium sp. LM4]